MNKNVLKTILSVFVGFLVFGILLFVLETLATLLYPPPYNIQDAAVIEAYLAKMPAKAGFSLIISYALASFAGGYFSKLVHPRGHFGIILSLSICYFLAGFFNFYSIHHPAWIAVSSCAVLAGFVWLGARLISTPKNSF